MFTIFDGPDANCILLSGTRPTVSDLSQYLEQNEVALRHVTSYEALHTTLETGGDANYILVDVDAFGGIDTQFERLRSLRDAFPDKPTILLSAAFGRDEFGTHRMMLGDVSLRVPVLHASIEIALLQAPVNNAEWRARFDEMQYERSSQRVWSAGWWKTLSAGVDAPKDPVRLMNHPSFAAG